MDARYQELASRIGLGHTRRIPQLFEAIADSTEADYLLALPGDAPGMAQKFGVTEEAAAGMLHNLFHKGLVFPSMKSNPPTYRMCRDLIQFHDATILWPEAPRSFLDLWQEFMEVEWPEYARQLSQIVPRGFSRVIPVGVNVEARAHVLAFEDVREIVEQAKTLAVTPCTCRVIARKCDHPIEACLQINNAAQYSITRGTGRQVSADEAMEIIRQAEASGLVHVVMNKRSVDHFICNCCSCCCQTMPILIQHGISVIDPSRFTAQVDSGVCTGCETCLDRCFFKAISMADDVAVINDAKCLGCGLCQVTCPSGAISLKETREQDFVPEKLFG
jgi:ferredoxin